MEFNFIKNVLKARFNVLVNWEFQEKLFLILHHNDLDTFIATIFKNINDILKKLLV
jgi:hypothetical protein